MSGGLTLSISDGRLDFGPEEERATFGLLSLTANGQLLTEGAAAEPSGARPQLRDGPHVSGYPLAEWLVWNWWRLRWESARPPGGDAGMRWDFAHRMTAVGDGYVWPDIEVFSEGPQTILLCEPSSSSDRDLFRYVGPARRETVPAGDLEKAIDDFVSTILQRLDRQQLRDTNLHRLWDDLAEERGDPGLSRFRRMEAQLGRDPDEIDEQVVQRCLEDAAALGECAWGEMAADIARRGVPPDRMASARDFRDMAQQSGFDARPGDSVRLDPAPSFPPRLAAWQLGADAAQQLRNREGLDGHPLSDERLAGFAGAPRDIVSRTDRRGDTIPYALDGNGGGARIVMRSKWETGRRFDLARLVGDRLLAGRLGGEGEPLFPATGAHTYRQRAQRAFAAELLSPFHAVEDLLAGDYSDNRQEDAAEHFNVSPMTIRTHLVNRHRIGRDEAPDIADRGAAGGWL